MKNNSNLNPAKRQFLFRFLSDLILLSPCSLQVSDLQPW